MVLFSGPRVFSYVEMNAFIYPLILFSSRCLCFLNWPFCVGYIIFRCWVAKYSHIFAAFGNRFLKKIVSYLFSEFDVDRDF